MKKSIKIEGMGCDHCIVSVKEALGKIEGLEILEVKLGEAIVEIKEEKIMNEVKENLEDAGYEVM